MQGLVNFKRGTKESGDNRNVVAMENATNFIGFKEIKQNNVVTRSLINRIHYHQATFLGHVMRREKLEHLVTTGMIERKHSREK